MNHLFGINAVICWWILHSCVITQVSLQLFLAREILFILDVVSALTAPPPFLTWCSSALWTVRIQHTHVACGIYGILAAQWVRKKLALFRWSCFSSPSRQKRPRQFAGQSSVWAAAPATKTPLSCHKGGNFVSFEASCSLTPHTEENAKIITIWGTSHIPFFVLVLLPFYSGKTAFHNCSLRSLYKINESV